VRDEVVFLREDGGHPEVAHLLGQVGQVGRAGLALGAATGDDHADDGEVVAVGEVAEGVVVGHQAAAVVGEGGRSGRPPPGRVRPSCVA